MDRRSGPGLTAAMDDIIPSCLSSGRGGAAAGGDGAGLRIKTSLSGKLPKNPKGRTAMDMTNQDFDKLVKQHSDPSPPAGTR